MATGDTSDVPASVVSGLADQASNLVLFVIVGLTVLWVISAIGESVLTRLRPLFPFLIAAGFFGFLAMRAISKL